MILYDNIQKVRDEVLKTGREVTMLAACKTQTKQTVDDFMKVAPDFVLGENRVQELLAKYDARYRWDFIGRLQTNKVKYIIDKAELIHSLDREELAKEIEKRAAAHGKTQKCLVEINMGSEISKGGVSPDGAMDFIKSLADYGHIEIDGLSAVMPNTDDEALLHSYYDRLYALFESAKSLSQSNANVRYLSAGMSNDYKIALAHGANIIRLGRILFGERQKIV